MKQYLDADDMFLITKQGFDFFHEQFGVRYPLPKYDQVCVPEFNAGAMENFGCVVHAEQHYIFRSPGHRLRVRAAGQHDPARDGPHVVRRPGHHALVGRPVAERVVRRVGQPLVQHPRHPVHRRVDDVPVDPQELGLPAGPALLHPPGLLRDARRGGRRGQLRRHHVRQGRQRASSSSSRTSGWTRSSPACARTSRKHAWGNATFDDLLSALEAASGPELREFAAQWLETAQVNTLRPEVDDRRRRHVRAGRRACRRRPAAYPTLRTHRIGVGLYDLVDGRAGPPRAASRSTSPASGPRSPSSPACRRPTCCCSTTTTSPTPSCASTSARWRPWCSTSPASTSSLARALCWAAAWDMVRDAELAARDYVALVCAGLPAETRHQPGHRDPARRRSGALAYVRRPGVGADRLGAMLAATARDRADRGRAGQRLPARLGAGVRLGRPLRRRTWPCCAAGWTATTYRRA